MNAFSANVIVSFDVMFFIQHNVFYVTTEESMHFIHVHRINMLLTNAMQGV